MNKTKVILVSTKGQKKIRKLNKRKGNHFVKFFYSYEDLNLEVLKVIVPKIFLKDKKRIIQKEIYEKMKSYLLNYLCVKNLVMQLNDMRKL